MNSFLAESSRLGCPAGLQLPLEGLARLRQGVYRYLGAALLYPDAEWAEVYPPIAESLAEETRPLAVFAFWGDWAALLGAMGAISADDRTALERMYTKDLLLNNPDCAPYETVYVERENVADRMAELDEFYAGDGFSLAATAHLTPDHVSVELEYLSVLCGLEAEAWEREDPSGGTERLRRQKTFLEKHLIRWLPIFAEGVRLRQGGSLYTLAAAAALAFVMHEIDLLTSLLVRYGETP